MKLSEEQLATVLAALRHWQETTDYRGRGAYPHFEEHCPLDDSEIDLLCEMINETGWRTKPQGDEGKYVIEGEPDMDISQLVAREPDIDICQLVDACTRADAVLEGYDTELTIDRAQMILAHALASVSAGNDVPTDVSWDLLQACRALAQAYQNGADNDGSMRWEDVDDAWQLAVKAIKRAEAAATTDTPELESELYILSHEHKYGVSSYPFRSSDSLSELWRNRFRVCLYLDVDYEPERGETIGIERPGTTDTITL